MVYFCLNRVLSIINVFPGAFVMTDSLRIFFITQSLSLSLYSSLVNVFCIREHLTELLLPMLTIEMYIIPAIFFLQALFSIDAWDFTSECAPICFSSTAIYIPLHLYTAPFFLFVCSKLSRSLLKCVIFVFVCLIQTNRLFFNCGMRWAQNNAFSTETSIWIKCLC